jgi:homoserine O-acetyltransferase/O-succinyltransferase
MNGILCQSSIWDRMSLPEISIFSVRDFRLSSGVVLPEARLAWRVEGERDDRPPILTCTAFSRACDDLAFLSAQGDALDPAKRWIVRTEALGNGRSSSPSKTPAPLAGADFPAISHADNVRLQKALLDHLGVTEVAAVVGASMGGQQAIQWAVMFPAIVHRAVVIVGAARTSWHGKLFVRAMADALMSDPAFMEGRYTQPPTEGLKRMSRAWAPWAMSPRFFSEGLYQDYADTRAGTFEAFLAMWERRYFGKDANDLLAMLRCWESHDIADGGDLAAAALKVTAEVLFLPSETDAYFMACDVADEAALFPKASVRVIPSVYGHAAGFARAAEDRAFLNREIAAFLAG